MFWTRIILSLAEFGLSIVLSVFVIFWSYKSFVRATTEYDAEEEIRKGNVAVAVLLSSLMAGSAVIFQQTVYPVIGILTLGLTASGNGLGVLLGYAAGQLILGFVLSVACVEAGLRLFELLTRGLEDDNHIQKGNVAVAVIMAAVVLILSMFMQEGVSSLNKTLIPQPKLGSLGVVRE
ncbi:MAG TPA: DUF350 domain-containing protein [Elusimicrobiota bacterium]|nr:DUF350 domain-containing protein [Elusimicrobiota bacterium]